jgi:hypothetical protein
MPDRLVDRVSWNLDRVSMTYADLSLEAVESTFGLISRPGELFPGLRPAPVAEWLRDYLIRGRRVAALVSAKARSEYLVAPILMAARDLTTSDLAVFSGQRLDVDPARGLLGGCDYIIALAPPVPRLRAPLITVLEAKKGDVDSALGQCAAQMIGARLFNERAGQGLIHVHGCATSGEVWQFLRLEPAELIVDETRFFLDNVGGILAALQAIVQQNQSNGAAGWPSDGP